MSIEIYPVVHVQDTTQAVEQSTLALEAGADGVYLIDHYNFDVADLIDAFNATKEERPNNFVGINFLQFNSAANAFLYLKRAETNKEIKHYPDGLWVDDAIPQKEKTLEIRRRWPNLRSIKYLGGVSFKYTKTYSDMPRFSAWEAFKLAPFVDVVTTSGSGTGKAPIPQKISAMKEVIGKKKLAVASGITAANLREYHGVDQLLVASSIEKEKYGGDFDPEKVAEIVQLAHAAAA